MKMKIGDSVKLKDGRKFKVVSKDNGYFILKDSKGKMAKIKDSRYLVYEWKEGFGRDNTNSPKKIATTQFSSLEEAKRYAETKAKELYNSVKTNNPYEDIIFGFEITALDAPSRDASGLICEYRIAIEGNNIEFYKREPGNTEDFTEEDLNFGKHIIRTDLTNDSKKAIKDDSGYLVLDVAKLILKDMIKTLDTGYELDRDEVPGNVVVMLQYPEKYALAQFLKDYYMDEDGEFILKFVKDHPNIDWTSIAI